MFSEVGLTAAFIGGFISFFSPCILPIIPGYLSFVAGGQITSRFHIFISTVFFVLGFTAVFTLLGTFMGAISSVFLNLKDWLNWIGGSLIIIFGLFTMKLINIPFLNQEHRIQSGQPQHKGLLSSFTAGAVFAIAWSPCVSAILASILVLAATSGSEAIGATLLIAFSLGLGIPFLLTGAFIDQARRFIIFSGPTLQYINSIAGALLIALGVLVFTNKLTLLIQLFI